MKRKINIHANTKGRNWMQKAVKKPNRVRDYMLRKYGAKAFNSDNTLRVAYIKKAIKETNEKSLKDALRLALVFHSKAKKK